MNSPQSQRFVAGLACRALDGTSDPVRLSRDVAQACTAIDASLNAIIGKQGTVALYRRCVFLVSARHHWMADLLFSSHALMDIGALQGALAEQSGSEACAAGVALLETIYDLLVSLIGASLTARLLPPVLGSSTGQAPQKDASP